LLIERDEGGTKTFTIVESLALAVADPPPDTLTWLTCGEVAFAVTLIVTVIAG